MATNNTGNSLVLIRCSSMNKRGNNWEWVCISQNVSMLDFWKKLVALCGDKGLVIFKNYYTITYGDVLITDSIKLENYLPLNLKQPDNEAHHGEILTVIYTARDGNCTNFTDITQEAICAPPEPPFKQILSMNIH